MKPIQSLLILAIITVSTITSTAQADDIKFTLTNSSSQDAWLLPSERWCVKDSWFTITNPTNLNHTLVRPQNQIRAKSCPNNKQPDNYQYLPSSYQNIIPCAQGSKKPAVIVTPKQSIEWTWNRKLYSRFSPIPKDPSKPPSLGYQDICTAPIEHNLQYVTAQVCWTRSVIPKCQKFQGKGKLEDIVTQEYQSCLEQTKWSRPLHMECATIPILSFMTQEVKIEIIDQGFEVWTK